MAELADALDSKSCFRKEVSVRPRPGAPLFSFSDFAETAALFEPLHNLFNVVGEGIRLEGLDDV